MTGAFVGPVAGKITFETFAEQWREVQVHRSSTASSVKSHLSHRVYPLMGARPIASLLPSHVQALV